MPVRSTVEVVAQFSLPSSGMLTALASGILLGLSAGLSPGPMLALVVAQSLRHGSTEGCKVALTPLVTDAPIIFIALVLAAKLAAFRPLLGVISIAGSVFVLYLAWETSRPARQNSEITAGRPRSWMKGVVTSLLNPHPWMFWLTVGAAVLGKAMAQSWLVAAAFLLGFCLLLVGSKVLMSRRPEGFRRNGRLAAWERGSAAQSGCDGGDVSALQTGSSQFLGAGLPGAVGPGDRGRALR